MRGTGTGAGVKNAEPVARRYAAALFAVAEKAGSTERAGQDLADLGRLVSEHAELRHVVASLAQRAGLPMDRVAVAIELDPVRPTKGEP